MTDSDIKTLAETEQRSISNTRRLDKLESDVSELQKDQRAIYQIAASVQYIAQQTKSTSDNVEALSDKIDKQEEARQRAEKELETKMTETEKEILTIKNAPAVRVSNNYEKVKVAVITALCSGLATTILYKLLSM